MRRFALVIAAVAVAAIAVAAAWYGLASPDRPRDTPAGATVTPMAAPMAAPTEPAKPSASEDDAPGLAEAPSGGAARIAAGSTDAAEPAEPLPREVVLSGYVVEADPGAAIDAGAARRGGATLLLHRGRRLVGTYSTHNDGTFQLQFEHTEPGPVPLKLTVERDEKHQRTAQKIELGPRERTRSDIVLGSRGFSDVAGRVVDTTGAPVPGVEVEFFRPPQTVISGEDGVFFAPLVQTIQPPVAKRAGWITLNPVNPLRSDAAGAWKPIEFVMTPSATLTVAVVDRSASPVVGRKVGIDIAPTERLGTLDGRYDADERWEQSNATDAAGQVTFEGVPTLQSLRIAASGRSFERVTSAAELVGTEASALSAPLVMQPGEARRVTLALGRPLRVAGRVLEPDGTPSPNARITVHPMGSLRPRSITSARTEDDGTFTIDTVQPETFTSLLIRAQGTIGELPPKNMFRGPRYPDPLHAGWTTVDPERASENVTIQLAVLGEVSGRAVAASGASEAEGRVTLHPTEPNAASARALSLASRTLKADGSFRFTGVPAGLYDVEVTGRDMGYGIAKSVAAGSTDVVVAMHDVALATVTLRIQSSVKLDKVTVLRSRLTPHVRGTVDAPILAPSVEIDRPGGWPRSEVGRFFGTGGSTTDEGRYSTSIASRKGDRKTYELEPGLYHFGARGNTAARHACFPVGTGLVRIEAGGVYDVTMHMLPCASIRGRVQEPGASSLYAEMRTKDGEPLAVDVRQDQYVETFPLRADGTFEIEAVPAQPLEVWIGTRAELRANRPAYAADVEPIPGATVELSFGSGKDDR